MITVGSVKREFGVTDEELQAAIEKSLNEKGGYDDRLYLAWSSDTDYVSQERTSVRDD